MRKGGNPTLLVDDCEGVCANVRRKVGVCIQSHCVVEASEGGLQEDRPRAPSDHRPVSHREILRDHPRRLCPLRRDLCEARKECEPNPVLGGVDDAPPGRRREALVEDDDGVVTAPVKVLPKAAERTFDVLKVPLSLRRDIVHGCSQPLSYPRRVLVLAKATTIGGEALAETLKATAPGSPPLPSPALQEVAQCGCVVHDGSGMLTRNLSTQDAVTFDRGGVDKLLRQLEGTSRGNIACEDL
mmetsp:Transcript_44308/g.94445  ORF Transcript_44308/g.94445 Transcript_44308/m.94445 type:complete len:242 (+) Transcript_44308:210-935(+)